MNNKHTIVVALVLMGLGLISSGAYAQGTTAPAPAAVPAQLDKLQRADGAKIVPERFLRSWDPVTVFFDSDTGPAKGGPEDAPERFVTMKPATPGAWQWLGARALQFRPADAWKPLQKVEFTVQNQATRLIALLPAPTTVSPTDRAEGITDLHEVTLTFAGPVDTAALARLLTIELRPAPGIDAASGQILGPQDFTVTPLERAKRDDKQNYLIALKSAVPDGRVLVLHLKLSDEPGLDEPVYEARIKSAVPFRASDATCANGFERDMVLDVLRCSPTSYVSSEPEEGEEASNTARGSRRGLLVSFTAKPQGLDAVGVRQALRITPPVDDLAATVEGSQIKLTGRFLADRVYQLRIEPGALSDEHGRRLEGAPLLQRFAFAPEQPSIKWDTAQGIVERFGPQMVPVRGRGYEKADVRIFAIDPKSREFWPFPNRGVETDDDVAPPLPGNEPKAWTTTGDTHAAAIAERIKALGSPAVSELLRLPIQRGGPEAKFGIDLKPHFAKIAGVDQPGTYLVGLRPTNGGKRQWLRAQVTDLSLSAVEEAGRVHFAVTSLSTASPVSQAQIRLEGVKDNKFVTLAEGSTGADGAFTWALEKRDEAEIKRVVVTKGLDTLIIEPTRVPSEYARENWRKPGDAWLAWTVNPKAERAKKPRTLCHVFTERPIYRPEESAHVKGYVRSYLGGKLSYAKGGGAAIISGPGKQEWRIPVKLDERGSFYFKFDGPTPATGDYNVRFEADGANPSGVQSPAGQAPAAQPVEAQPEPQQQEAAPAENQEVEAAEPEGEPEAADAANGNAEQNGEGEGEGEGEEELAAAEGATSCGLFPFKKEAYRLPTFEAVLNSPPRVPLDGEFNVNLLARYFAGGLVAERPIKWRVVQFPFAWTPPGREGFVFSSDSRFSGDTQFKSSPFWSAKGAPTRRARRKSRSTPPSSQPRSRVPT